VIGSRRPLQARHELRFGTRELVIFCGAFVLVWGLTFVFGILVGREMTNPTPEKPRPTAGAARSSLAEPVKKVERAGTDERLTFYKTLTAPTAELPPTEPPKVEEHIVPREPAPHRAPAPAPPAPAAVAPAPAAAPATEHAAEAPAEEPAARRPPRERPVVASRPAASRRVETAVAPAAAPAHAPPAGTDPLWTVQVSSFRSRALAEELRGRLAAKGFDAYLVSVTSEEGRVRHRVRVGAFPTRTEAERVAVELKGERSLNPFVTTRQR
jgi:cell division septation protein DedD